MSPYHVLYPGVVRGTVRALLEKAAGLGIRAEIAATLRMIDEQLHADPLAYGDVHNRLQRWTRCVRVQTPLFVCYAVSTFLHEGSHLVYVSAIGPLSGHGL